MKKMKTLAIGLVLLIVIAFGVWYASNQTAANNTQSFPSPTNSASNTPTPTPFQTLNPATKPNSSPTPPQSSPTPNASPQGNINPTNTPTAPITVTFDFDTGTPTPGPSMTIPFNQTKNAIIAQFSSPMGPAFSIQNYQTTFFKLSQFQGNYLYDNQIQRDTLEIRFSQPVSSISFVFATVEYHGAPTDLPSNLTLTAYADSTSNTPVGSTNAHGSWPETTGDAYPQGTLTFNSPTAFNIVKIELPYQGPAKATDYFIDTITVTTA